MPPVQKLLPAPQVQKLLSTKAESLLPKFEIHEPRVKIPMEAESLKIIDEQISGMKDLDRFTGQFNDKILGIEWKKFQQGVPILHGLNAYTSKGTFSMNQLMLSIENAPIKKQQEMIYNVNKFVRGVKNASSGQRAFNMDLLSGMFFFMSLSMVINSFLKPSREASGVWKTWADYMTVLFMPAALFVLDWAVKIGNFLLWLTNLKINIPFTDWEIDIGRVFGFLINSFMLVMSVLATLASFAFQVLLGAGGISWSITKITEMLNTTSFGKYILSIGKIGKAYVLSVISKIKSSILWTKLFGASTKSLRKKGLFNLGLLSSGWLGVKIASMKAFLMGVTGATTFTGALLTMIGVFAAVLATVILFKSSLDTNFLGIGEKVMWLYSKFVEFEIGVLKIAEKIGRIFNKEFSLGKVIKAAEYDLSLAQKNIEKLKEKGRGSLSEMFASAKEDVMKVLGFNKGKNKDTLEVINEQNICPEFEMPKFECPELDTNLDYNFESLKTPIENLINKSPEERTKIINNYFEMNTTNNNNISSDVDYKSMIDESIEEINRRIESSVRE